MNFIWSSQATPTVVNTSLEVAQVLAVDDQQLVLVELHFLRHVRVQHGDARAAVVEQQVLVVAEHALEHRQVDVLAVQVDVAAVLRGCGWFPAPRRPRAQRVEQLQEHVEQLLVRGGGHQHRHRDLAIPRRGRCRGGSPGWARPAGRSDGRTASVSTKSP